MDSKLVESGVIHKLFTDRFLVCCLPQEQREDMRTSMENEKYTVIYQHQKNFVKEKTGYCCSVCGKFYPYLQIDFEDKLMDLNEVSKPIGKVVKYRKSSAIFCNDHYYAKNKKTLLKFELDADQNMQQTDAIPIMGEVYHSVVSKHEKYIATETFQGTIAIVDVLSKQIVAQKRKCKINGSFIFFGDDTLLYFFEDAIRYWNFLENKEKVIWTVPAEWKISEKNIAIHVVCHQVLCNDKKNTYLFQCKAGDNTYVVVIKDMQLDEMIQLGKTPALCKLVYTQELDQYTLISEDNAVIYDGNFNITETFAYPQLRRISDGGGIFPITQQTSGYPHRIFLSPDGRWILLDYFTSVLLMKHEGYEIKFSLFSYTGKTAQYMGFVDNQHFWYTWGDTTYIQEIAE